MPTIDYAKAKPTERKADALVLPVAQGPDPGPGVKEVARALGDDLLAAYAADGLKGKAGETLTVPTFGRLPARTVVLAGVGEDPDASEMRRLGGKLAKSLRRYARVTTTVPQAAKGGYQAAVQAFAEGLLLGGYRFDRYRTADQDAAALDRVTILGGARWDARAAKRALARAEILASSAAWARDLVNTPALDAPPAHLAAEARRMAKEVGGLTVKVLTKAQLTQGGFGGILGVGSGSERDPRLIEITYGGASGPPIGLVGKGITFDSGGLSIKPAASMEWMKADMSGAAAVLATMRAIAMLKPKVKVVAAIPAAENVPSGTSIRPGDVLTHRGGKTSEVLNTDAEGRLIMADALAYLAEKSPALMIDTATLTGAAMVALGDEVYGVMGTDDDLVADILAAGERVGEPGWPLPLWAGYREKIASQIADVKNTGGRWAGAITAGLFLKEFVGDVPWAHIDIAGVAYAEKPGDLWGKGATGIPVRTLVDFIEHRGEKR